MVNTLEEHTDNDRRRLVEAIVVSWIQVASRVCRVVDAAVAGICVIKSAVGETRL